MPGGCTTCTGTLGAVQDWYELQTGRAWSRSYRPLVRPEPGADQAGAGTHASNLPVGVSWPPAARRRTTTLVPPAEDGSVPSHFLFPCTLSGFFRARRTQGARRGACGAALAGCPKVSGRPGSRGGAPAAGILLGEYASMLMRVITLRFDPATIVSTMVLCEISSNTKRS